MKKVMISQPMKDKTQEEIIKERDNAKKYLESKGYEVVNTFFEEDWNKEIGNSIIHEPLFFLGKSIAYMSQCDAIYFASGWALARGCRVERLTAILYGIEIITDEEKDEEIN